jgi:hypothetical protein
MPTNPAPYATIAEVAAELNERARRRAMAIFKKFGASCLTLGALSMVTPFNVVLG